MKKSIFVLALLSLFAAPAFSQIKINPKVGITLSRLDGDPNDFETSARPGFTAGADLRLGKRFYFQPGLHYNVMSYQLIDLKTDGPNQISDVTGLKSLKLPLNVGLNIIDLKLLRLRAFGGANLYQVTGVTKNDIGVTRDDFAKRYWGANAGVGLDLLFLTLDLQYEWGQSNIFAAQPDTKYGTLALTAGLKF